MNNRPNTRAGADPTATKQPFSIGDAADRLGMTSEAVRMRLKRGTLQGEKLDGRWIVYLDQTEQPPKQPTEHDVVHDYTTDQTTPEHAPRQPTERDQTETVAVYRELVASQSGEIEFLRGQLDRMRQSMDAERERFDVIHREALHRIEALTAGEKTAAQETEEERAARLEIERERDELRAEVELLREIRLHEETESPPAPETPTDPVAASPESPGAHEPIAMTPDTLQSPSRVTGLVRRLFGRS